MNAIYAIAHIVARKSQDPNGAWTHDPAIPERRSSQLSNEATDIGGWSFVGPNELSWLERRTGITRSRAQTPLKSRPLQASIYATA